MEICLLPLNKIQWQLLSDGWWCRFMIVLMLWCLSAAAATGQAREWDKTLGGDLEEGLWALQQTRDGGYLLGGWSESDKSDEKSQDGQGAGDYWVVKLDAAGNKVWDKTFGGSEDDILITLQQTSDGGYILGGNSDSESNGDKSQASKGASDYWVVKLDEAGNKLWDKSFGGNKEDYLVNLQQTLDGGYILGGFSDSDISSDKTAASRGSFDYWVVKLNAAGNKVWDRTYGGIGEEDLYDLQQTTDGGYILGGFSDSGISGEKSQASKGGADYWAVKVDAAGNKLWDKSFGGNGTDEFRSLQQTTDGGYILGGFSDSDISGDKSQASKGAADYWMVKLDMAGNKQWDKTFGSNGYDEFAALQQTRDGGYILGGDSNAGISGDKTEALRGVCEPTGFCPPDYWVVKLDASGNKQWDKTFGGTGEDYLFALQQTLDGGYILGGDSNSDAGGDKTQNRRGPCDETFCLSDYWVVKINGDFTPATPRILSFSPKKDVPGTIVTINGSSFLSTWSVRFNGFEAPFEVISDEEIKATVPVLATTGKIIVANATGVAVSAGSFRVRQPAITAFSPGQGPAGTTVNLEGSRLNTTAAVYFGGVPALEFTVLSSTAMTAVVPEGALNGRIKVVLAGGGYGNSKTKFVVTPPGATAPLADQKLERKATNADLKTNRQAPGVTAYPNPFRQQVSFNFTLPQPQPVTVKVYDLLGREVHLLYQGEARAHQAYQVDWRPETHLPGGLYLIRLQTPGQVRQMKVLLAR